MPAVILYENKRKWIKYIGNMTCLRGIAMDFRQNLKKRRNYYMYVFTSLVYFMSYITRVNYNTILVEISSAENIPRSLLALPLTASFVTYGFPCL